MNSTDLSNVTLTTQPAGEDGDDLEALGEQIAELSAHIEAATYRLLCLIREFDERQGWAKAGAGSCAQWLAWRVGISAATAREKVRVARSLNDLPLVSEALRHGEISYSKARAITRVATPENEEALLTFARYGTAAHLERIIRRHRRVTADEENNRHEGRGLHTRWDDSGMLVVQGRLTPEQGAVFLRALELAGDELARPAREAGDEGGEVDAEAVSVSA
jgi:hypothetical protein